MTRTLRIGEKSSVQLLVAAAAVLAGFLWLPSPVAAQDVQ